MAGAGIDCLALENLFGNFYPEKRAYIFNLVCNH